MKTRLWVIGILFITILIGCGERKSPLQPGGYYRLVGEIQTPGWAKDVCALNDTAYVADNEGGIAVIDIRNVTNPVYIESWATLAPVKIIKVAPLNRLILTYEDEAGSATLDKLRMYSVDFNVQVAEAFDTGLTGFKYVEGTETIWIYETDSNDGFAGDFYQKYDSTTWFREDAINSAPPPMGICKELDLNGPTNGFVALDERGVLAFEIVADTLVWLGGIDTPGAAYDLVYQDGYLYVADYFNGLAIINATNPDSLVLVSQIRPSGSSRCEKVIVQGTVAALLDTYDGIYVIDVSVPSSPSIIDFIALPEPTGLAFDGDRLLVTDEDQGLLIFQQ